MAFSKEAPPLEIIFSSREEKVATSFASCLGLGLMFACFGHLHRDKVSPGVFQVCLTCCTQEVLLKVDQICNKHGIKFFTGDVFGYHGYMFANLGEHEFVE